MRNQSLNQCSGCHRNFAGSYAHEMHRVGSYQERTRRCLTSAEMVSKGFTVCTEPVTRTREGLKFVEQMETWQRPADEKALARFEQMKAQKAGAA